MSELGPEDEALLQRARAGVDASSDDHARVKRKLFAQLGIGAAVGGSAISTSTGASAGAAGAGAAASVVAGTGIVTKVVVAVLLAGVVTGGVMVGRRSRSPSSVAPPSASVPTSTPMSASQTSIADIDFSAPANSIAPPNDSLPSPRSSTIATSASSDRTPERARSGDVAPPSAPASSAPPRQDSTASTPIGSGETPAAVPTRAPAGPATVDAEAALLRRADTELKAGRANSALALLDEHAAHFPNGILLEERDAERVIVLCALGRTQDARDAAAAFLSTRPRSPLASRVRASCGGN